MSSQNVRVSAIMWERMEPAVEGYNLLSMGMNAASRYCNHCAKNRSTSAEDFGLRIMRSTSSLRSGRSCLFAARESVESSGAELHKKYEIREASDSSGTGKMEPGLSRE